MRYPIMALDLVVLGILLFSALVAFMRGFIREVLTICGLIGAAIASLYGGPQFAPVTKGWMVDPDAEKPQKLFNLIPYDMVATALAYLIVFVVVLIALNVLAYYISKAARAAGLGPIDRSLGVVFGLLRGVLLIGLLYLPAHIMFTTEQKQDWFGDSKTLPYVTYTAELMQALLPGAEVTDKFKTAKGGEDNSAFDPLKDFSDKKTATPEKADEPAKTDDAKTTDTATSPKSTRYND